MKALLIAKNWPEPKSTAAGRRTLNLLNLISNLGYQIHVACAAQKTPFQACLADAGYTETPIAVNDHKFDDYLTELRPQIVIFDRFVMEEQFGWRVRNKAPNAMTILDTSDLHCLRSAREQAFKHNTAVDLFNQDAIREVASILRCDLTLMISEVELELLKTQFNIPAGLLYYLPFLVKDSDYKPGMSYTERKHLVMFGGFKHAPNRDAAHWLKAELWPAIRKHLPCETELHIYGGYADHAITQLHNPKDKFFIKGRAECALTTMGQYRLNLAPLRFGAGQKGKILEGWLTGTPTITSAIGAESMAESKDLLYQPTEDPELFAQLVKQAYEDNDYWHQLQSSGYKLLNRHYQYQSFVQDFEDQVRSTINHLDSHRHKNFFGRILWQNQFRASEYMSRWIELKNSR